MDEQKGSRILAVFDDPYFTHRKKISGVLYLQASNIK